jgi:Rrf2 family protein
MVLSFSKRSAYAIIALSCLDGPEGKPMRAIDIARTRQIPKHYLSKIVIKLAKSGLLKAKRGPSGGLTLSKFPQKISIEEIVTAMEGPDWCGECLLGMDSCDSSCPTHEFWQREKKRIKEKLSSISVSDFRKVGRNIPSWSEP